MNKKVSGKECDTKEVESEIAFREKDIKEKEQILAEKRKETARMRRSRAMSRLGPLYISEDLLDTENFAYRIVNHSAQESNIRKMQDFGYEVVSEKNLKIGDESSTSSYGLGSVVSRPVGGGLEGVLMRIPKDLYEEGQKIIEEENRRIERQIQGDGKLTKKLEQL